eukprot:scaffold69604_cov65-Phaeocystis_antarctica.AAC.2
MQCTCMRCTCGAHAVHMQCNTQRRARGVGARPNPNPSPNPNPNPNPKQVLAAPLVRALVAAPGLHAFIAHAHEMRREYKVDSEG